jgi:flagellar biosynthesis/type III secretory pathway protein FliH
LFGGADRDDDINAGVESLAPPLPPPASEMPFELAERLGRAIEVLQLTADRLGAEVAATSLEIGCLIARRILEAELTTNVEAQRSLVRSAVRRLGDAHKVTIHLCPTDVEAVRAAAGHATGHAGGHAAGHAGSHGGGADVKTDLGMNLGIAKVEILPDTNLTPGDCLVESDAASVDGRLGTRLEEVRRVLSGIINDHAGETP